MAMPARSCARAKRGDGERLCELVDLRQDRRIERHAVALPLGPARRPTHAGDANIVTARQPPRRDKIANVAIDLSLERVERHEPGNIECDDELPDIAVTARRRGEIANLAAERRAVERPRQ